MTLQTFSGRRPSQDERELGGLVELLLDRGVRSYLEIGARHGDTFHHVMTALPQGARGVAVDLAGGLWGTDKSKKHLERAVRDLRGRKRLVHAVFGDSGSAEVLQQVRELGPYDAALIDGDHTYEGVARDWRNYRGLAPLVAFHDVVGDGQVESVHGNAVEVPRLWKEIKATAGIECWEFISPGSKMGIGVCAFAAR